MALMNEALALQITDRYDDAGNPSKADTYAFVEALTYLAVECKNSYYMAWLGGYYYDAKRFDLAEKYYLMGAAYDELGCLSGLGYIYYYGRVGKVDYEKAFFYYQKAFDQGDKESGMKIADMYHHGLGVAQNEEKYQTMVRELYASLQGDKKRSVYDPVPELAERLGDILLQEGKSEEAEPILRRGLSYIEQRLRFNAFWGNVIIAKRLAILYYSIVELPMYALNFISLFAYFQKPNVAILRYGGKKYKIVAYEEDGGIRIQCGKDVYPDYDAFYRGHLFGNKHVGTVEIEGEFAMNSPEFEGEYHE